MVLAQKQTYRSMKQNREPKINLHTYGQLIYNEGGKNTQWRKESLFSKWCWNRWKVTCKSMKLENTPYTKINLKWFKDLTIRHDTIKLLEVVSDINHSNISLDQSPKVKEIKAKINK